MKMVLQDRIDEIMKGLPPSLSSLKIPQDLYELNYLQHLPQDVDDVQNKFIELVDEVLGTSYSGKEVHRHGIVGRVLDDSGNNDLYRAWYRFMCIDTQYREWTQPAFAMTEPSKFVCVNKDNPKLIAYFRDKKLEQILVESELQKSVKNLIQVKNDQKRLDDFAKARYDENFPIDPKKLQGWHHYDEFKIINETTLRIKYKHGFGDYEYDESFDVDLTPYYRDEKLEKI